MGRNRHLLPRYSATRVVGLTALCGLVALGLGGVEKAATATTPGVATSADFTVDLQLALPGHFVTTLQGDGRVDFADHDATMTVTVPTAGLHSSAIGQGLTPSDTPLELHTEWINGVIYLAVPAALATAARGATSLSHRLPAGQTRSIDTALAQSAVALTYARILVDTMARKQAQHAMGTRTIDGTRASGTQVELSLSQLLKLIPGLAPAVSRDTKAMGTTKIPTTVWVDHAGRLVEAVLAAGLTPNGGSLTGTVEFGHYDAPLTITAPRSGTVRTMSQSVLAILRMDDPLGAEG